MTALVDPTNITITPNALWVHQLRSLMRNLVSSAIVQWDAGDVTELHRRFGDAELILDGEPTSWNAAASWSVTLSANETIDVRGDVVTGTWLVAVLSIDNGAATSMWRGGDLAVRAVSDGSTLRVERVEYVSRLRAPVAEGWLDNEIVVGADLPRDDDADDDLPAFVMSKYGLGLHAGPLSLEQLCAEVDLQALAAAALRHLEAGDVDGATVPQRLLTTPRLAVDPSAAVASGTWRELVVVPGEPRWQVNEVAIDARRSGGVWVVESLLLQPIVDVAYGASWRSGVVVGSEPVAIDVTNVGTVPATEPSLAVLDAVDAIRRVHTEYMAACDAHDPSRVVPLFVPNGLWETMDGSEVLNGVDEIRAAYDRDCTRLTFCIHFLGNERIQVDPGATTAFAAFSYFEPATNRGDLAVWTAGRYELQLVATADGWRYVHFQIEPRLAAPFDGGWAESTMIPLP